MSAHATAQAIYGLMAEFDDPTAWSLATRQTHEEGYREHGRLFAVSDRGADRGVARRTTTGCRCIVLVGGILGWSAGFGLQYWVSVIAYPMNIGGRPFNSWPSFIPVTFELTILFASFAAVLGMIVLNGLPMPYHPVFNVPRFADASASDKVLPGDRSDRPEVRPATHADF